MTEIQEHTHSAVVQHKVLYCMSLHTDKPLNKDTEGGHNFMSFLRGQSCSEVHLPLMYVIGGRLLVHCTEGHCSLEVPDQRFTCTQLIVAMQIVLSATITT